VDQPPGPWLVPVPSPTLAQAAAAWTRLVNSGVYPTMRSGPHRFAEIGFVHCYQESGTPFSNEALPRRTSVAAPLPPKRCGGLFQSPPTSLERAPDPGYKASRTASWFPAGFLEGGGQQEGGRRPPDAGRASGTCPGTEMATGEKKFAASATLSEKHLKPP